MSQIKKVSNEVFVALDPIVQVDGNLMEMLKTQAAQSPKHRARLCAHKDGQDRLHEMLIVLTRNVYIRPHKHINKTESFHVINGSADVIFFDENGGVQEVIKIGDSQSGRPFYFRNDSARYHTQIITSDFLVFHEITNGPFNRADTVFAPWSPDENDADAVTDYAEKLKRSGAGFSPQ